MSNKREFRFLKTPIELRESPDGKPVIAGYASVFMPSQSEDLGGFIEQVDPHAFDDAVSGDVRGLFNHNPDYVLGRTKSGTMRLSVDSRGLKYEIDVPDTQAGRDVVTSIKRGDIDGSSFGFICEQDAWEFPANAPAIRTLMRVSLLDCSPVTYPAYPDATSQVRSLWPDGKPEIPAPEQRDGDEEENSDCRCECDSCRNGNCAECSDDPCDCEGCDCNQFRCLRSYYQFVFGIDPVAD